MPQKKKVLDKEKCDELARIAMEQLTQGLLAKSKRMDTVREYMDLYNNKVIEVDDGRYNAPFPYFADFIDGMCAKTDNPPSLDFKIPNKKTLSEKVKAAWMQESSSTKAGWARKDRSEKFISAISGRAVSKVYASSVDGKYQSHYELVDIFSFVADPTRGQLMDGNYHGETDIWKTKEDLEYGAEQGWYDKRQVELLSISESNQVKDGTQEVMKNKYDRLKALGIDVQSVSHAGQKGRLMCEWLMRSGGEWYYLLFDPKTGIWVRCQCLQDVFESGKTPFVSWATHYDEYSFWSKSLADDIAPVSESMRFLVNDAIENQKRRNRPMRIVQGGAFADVGELMDYVPDNVIITNNGRESGIITVETPEVTGTINLLGYLDSTSQQKAGNTGSGVDENNAKVGIFYGKLQQEADRIGRVNKEYSESYAWKGYNFFWGLKQHLSEPKRIEMLGKSGLKLDQLETFELADVDDVDDVIVAGGSAQDQLDAVQTERQLKTLAELTGAYPQAMNPNWVIRQSLKAVGFDEDDVNEAIDVQGSVNRELMEEADQSIQDILLGGTPKLNNGADIYFMQRIKDFVTDNMDWVTVVEGKPAKIDAKKKAMADKLLAYMMAHQAIVIQNQQRSLRQQQWAMQAGTAQSAVNVPGLTHKDQNMAAARPFESPTGTPQGTASASQSISGALSA